MPRHGWDEGVHERYGCPVAASGSITLFERLVSASRRAARPDTATSPSLAIYLSLVLHPRSIHGLEPPVYCVSMYTAPSPVGFGVEWGLWCRCGVVGILEKCPTCVDCPPSWNWVVGNAASAGLTSFDIPGAFEARQCVLAWMARCSFLARLQTLFKGTTKYLSLGRLLHCGWWEHERWTLTARRPYWTASDSDLSLTSGWPAGWQNYAPYTVCITMRLPTMNVPSTDGQQYLEQSVAVVGVLLESQAYETRAITDEGERLVTLKLYTPVSAVVRTQRPRGRRADTSLKPNGVMSLTTSSVDALNGRVHTLSAGALRPSSRHYRQRQERSPSLTMRPPSPTLGYPSPPALVPFADFLRGVVLVNPYADANVGVVDCGCVHYPIVAVWEPHGRDYLDGGAGGDEDSSTVDTESRQ
ncbi:hypothetical protein C8R43DRAFT_959470 [Mycena crocata]|nr:hypothetical protein C8R43DRAFT_959470 [Mycena crocata]